MPLDPKYQPNCTISFRDDINDELMIVRLRPDFPAPVEFTPGQYAELAIIDEAAEQAGTVERRQYSIASAATDGSELEFYVVLVPNGFFTTKLWKMGVGDRLWINPKTKGKFTLEPVPPEQTLVLVSTGTGLAPYVSMLRTFINNPPWKNVIIVHGVRYERDLGYRAELEELTQSHPHILYVPATTREEEGSKWSGLQGRLPGLFESGAIEQATGIPLEGSSCQVFLCGNPAMIDEMQALLESRGFRIHKKKEPGNIHLERYW